MLTRTSTVNGDEYVSPKAILTMSTHYKTVSVLFQGQSDIREFEFHCQDCAQNFVYQMVSESQ